MAQYYHMLVKINPLKFKEGNSFFLTCCDCQKQTEGRVCRVSWSAEENAYSAPVTPRVTESYTKKFLDEVFGGNCGEVVAQYSGLNGINSRNYYPIIIEPVPELFLSFGSNFISRIHMDYTNTLHKYERAKKNAGLLGKIKAAILQSRIRKLSGEYFDDKNQKILKIALQSDSLEKRIDNIEEYYNFLINSDKGAYLDGEFKISYDFFELDKLMRETTSSPYSYIEVAKKFAEEVPGIVTRVSVLDITFSYNKTFCSQIRHYVSLCALNDDECMEILDSVHK